jgi:hypothetical protein
MAEHYWEKLPAQDRMRYPLQRVLRAGVGTRYQLRTRHWLAYYYVALAMSH